MSKQPAGNRANSVASGQRVFTRQATGLVREAGVFSTGIFSICGAVGIVFVAGLFWAFSLFPRANMLLAIVLGGVLCSFVWACWALLATAMPRVGADYLYNSRILGPVYGFVANFMLWVSGFASLGLWTAWLSTLGLASAFAIFGVLTGSGSVVDLSAAVANPTIQFVLGALLVLAVCGVAILGLKASLFMQNLTFLLATGGLLLAMVVMLFTSTGSFAANFNQFAEGYTNRPDSYQHIMQLARAEGYQSASTAGYSLLDTLGATWVVMTASIWAWNAAYLAGEMKGARMLNRQLAVMVGAGTVQILLLFVATALFFKAVGYDFFSGINYLYTVAPDQYPLPAPPYYSLFAGIMVTNPLVQALIVFSFVLNMWGGVWGIVLLMSRQMFAWSFDGLMPAKLAETNPRTHTPVNIYVILAVAGIIMSALAAWWVGMTTVWSLVGLLAFSMIGVTAISAILLPIRRPEVFERSAARVRLFGIPMVQIFGILALLSVIVYIGLLFRFPMLVAGATLGQLVLFTIGVAVVGAVIFYGARAIRSRQGVKLDRAYEEIPPE